MTRLNDSFCELKSFFLTTESGQICQLTRIIESPIPDSEAPLPDVMIFFALKISGLHLCKCPKILTEFPAYSDTGYSDTH